MNVCAVRTLTNSISATGGIAGIWWSSLLPHEPKSDERLALEVREWAHSLGINITYAECRHCGCIYAVED